MFVWAVLRCAALRPAVNCLAGWECHFLGVHDCTCAVPCLDDSRCFVAAVRKAARLQTNQKCRSMICGSNYVSAQTALQTSPNTFKTQSIRYTPFTISSGTSTGASTAAAPGCWRFSLSPSVLQLCSHTVCTNCLYTQPFHAGNLYKQHASSCTQPLRTA